MTMASALQLTTDKQYVVRISGVGSGVVTFKQYSPGKKIVYLQAVTRFGASAFCCGEVATFFSADVSVLEAL